MSSSSPALDDDEVVSKDGETTRRRLPVVYSINLGCIIDLAEGQVGQEPGYFFAAMPTQRTPKTGKKSTPSASPARKTSAKKVLAARMAEQEAAGKASEEEQPTATTLLRVGSREAKKGVGPTGEAGPGAQVEEKEAAKQLPRKRPSWGTDGKGAPEPKKSLGDIVPPVGAAITPVDEVEAATRKDQDISASPSSDRSSLLSYGSDTDYFSDLYVIMDAKVKKNGLLVLASLLRPGIIQDVEITLEEEVDDVNVFFPVFTRYFLAKGKSFQMMVADLLRHRKVNQNGGAPLILRADVQRLREIAHNRMAFVKITYKSYRAMNPPQDKDNVDIIRLHMKTCIKNYHALLPQLDLIATQYGVEKEDTVSQDDVGSLRSETVRQKRTKALDKQLRDQVRDTRRTQVGDGDLVRRDKGKSSGSSNSEELTRMTNQAREGVRKRRLT
jgi:hypothetical protein